MFSRVRAVVEKGIQKQLHLGVQLSISTPEREFDIAFGEAEIGRALSSQNPVSWLSAGKPLTAVAVLQLAEQGRLDLDGPVQDVLPEFQIEDQMGRAVTIFQLLTHTSAVPDVATGWPDAPHNEIIARICSADPKPEWDSMQRAAYSPSATWFLLGEIVSRSSGLEFADWMSQRVLGPCGMSQTSCLPVAANSEASSLRLYDRVKGQLEPSVFMQRLAASVPSPGSSFRGPSADLRRFYETLLSDLTQGSQTLLSTAMLERMIARQRTGLFDETLQHVVDYGLGVIVDSKQYGAQTVPYGFGEASSDKTFGHGGSQCAIGFADPVTRRCVVLIANGRPGEGQHQRRFRDLLAALEADWTEQFG